MYNVPLAFFEGYSRDEVLCAELTSNHSSADGRSNRQSAEYVGSLELAVQRLRAIVPMLEN